MDVAMIMAIFLMVPTTMTSAGAPATFVRQCTIFSDGSGIATFPRNSVASKEWQRLAFETLLPLRGGAVHDKEDAIDDEYDPANDDHAQHHREARQWHPNEMDSPQQQQQRRPPPPRRRRAAPPPPSLIDMATSAVKTTANLSARAAITSLKTTGNAALFLATPKHIERDEIYGLWRFDQQVGRMPHGPFTSCAANIEFTRRGDAVTRYFRQGESADDGKMEVDVTRYNFVQRTWPRSCKLEFVARAFQGPHDELPRRMFYKGYFSRKVADFNIVKIKGKIYEWRPPRRGILFGGQRPQSKPHAKDLRLVGTFTAKRRINFVPKTTTMADRTGQSTDDQQQQQQQQQHGEHADFQDNDDEEDEEESEYDEHQDDDDLEEKYEEHYYDEEEEEEEEKEDGDDSHGEDTAELEEDYEGDEEQQRDRDLDEEQDEEFGEEDEEDEDDYD